MASENTKRLYKHYLSIAPMKARQAAELLEKFPELSEKPVQLPADKDTQPPEEEPKKEVSKEVKSDGKKPKR